MKERRRARRRSIPFVRSAVLEVEGRSHIVALLDLGPDGAFLQTRTVVEPTQALRLRLVLPLSGQEVIIPCQLVWRSERFDAVTGRPAGLAVRFQGLDAGVIRRVEEFALEGFLPAPNPAPSAHYEYRLLDRPEVDAEELNHLGFDGWRLAAALPSPAGVRLILLRRL
jgi:hypothetical protein